MTRRIGVVAAIVLLSAACGASSESASDPAFRSTDGATLDVDDQDLPENDDGAGSGGASEGDSDDAAGDDDPTGDGDPGATTSTIPLNEDEDTVGTMFEALRTFNDCLDELGVTFLGDPRNAEPGSPAADPDYLEDLSTCAARSNILEAMQSMQSANEGLTPEEIEERNRGIQAWAECMRGRGWTLELTPDDRGMLNPTTMEGPAGSGDGLGGIFESDDMEECAAESQADVEQLSGDGEE